MTDYYISFRYNSRDPWRDWGIRKGTRRDAARSALALLLEIEESDSRARVRINGAIIQKSTLSRESAA